MGNGKVQQPKHIEVAIEISHLLISEFSGVQQHEFLKEVFKRIESNYQEQIADLEAKLKDTHSLYESFKRGTNPVTVSD